MIVLRSDDEISSIRGAAQIVKATLDLLETLIKPGVSTAELDAAAGREILKRGGCPAFKGVRIGNRRYPSNICTSINEIVVHGIPSDRTLVEGDLVSIDAGVKFKGYYADAAITVGVGRVSPSTERLISATRNALSEGIETAVAGNRLGDISARIQRYVEGQGFSVVRDLVGHGIGTALWEEPQIPNYGSAGTGPRLENGMVLAVEPMVNAGTYEVEVLEDGWAVATRDRKRSAHFEHTIVIRDDAAEVLTG